MGNLKVNAAGGIKSPVCEHEIHSKWEASKSEVYGLADSKKTQKPIGNIAGKLVRSNRSVDLLI